MGRLISIGFGLVFLISISHGQISMAPSVIGAGGGYAENEDISLSWTLGELATSTLTGGDLMLTQGFQQPFTLGTGVRPPAADWLISVYPNPLSEKLRIRFDIESPEEFLLEIQDVTGRLIRQIQQTKVNPRDVLLINTSTYTPGIYFLKVFTSDRQQVQVTSLRKL
jgi:hypothetical protein